MKLRVVKIENKLIPEWNGNKKLPTPEQLRIHFSRIPGTSEKDKFSSMSHSLHTGTTVSYDNQSLCIAFVNRVDNFEIEVKGEIRKVVNGADLAEINHHDIDDLFLEIRNHLFPIGEDLEVGESEA